MPPSIASLSASHPPTARHIGGLTGLDIKYGLTPEVAKSDLEEMTTTADRYSGRSASIIAGGAAMRGRY